ncbi:CBS domain-containing protein [Paractinoplanes durhamensis]|nr:CBS domain-containing protein [Actinoplanes durhamensis]
MTRTVISVDRDASYRNMVDLLIHRRISALPVIDDAGRVLGIVSEADLLRKIEFAGEEEPRIFEGRRRRDERRKSAGRTAADLMSTPCVAVTSDTSIALAARTMHASGVRRLPIIDQAGMLVGIVSRSDLLRVHTRPDEEIRADIEHDVLGVFLIEEADGVSVAVADGMVTLTGKVDRRSSAEMAERLTREVAGVVGVTSTLDYSFDDRRVR